MYSYKKGNFSLEDSAMAPNVPLSYTTDILQNYIPLSHLHYIQHAEYIKKVDKPVIDVMIARESDIRELI